MKFKEVMDRILTDKAYAKTMRDLCRKAARAGTGTDPWGKFMGEFAENSEELARMIVPGKIVGGKRIDTTLTMLTLVGCGAGTNTFQTTTTASVACLPEPKSSRRKSK